MTSDDGELKASTKTSALATVFSRFPVVGFVSQAIVCYNFFSMAICLAIMEADGIDVPSWATDLVNGAILIGSCAGMLVMGYYGDKIGRSRSLVITLTIAMVGSMWGAGVWGLANPVFFFGCLAASRFLVGFGIGGIYPCVGCAVAEAFSDVSVLAKRISICVIYSGQAVGYVAPYSLVVILKIPYFNLGYSTVWRATILTGGLMVLVLFSVTNVLIEGDSDVFVKRQAISKGVGAEVSNRIGTKKYFFKLLGSGGSWFFFDFTLFAFRDYAPTIVATVFNSPGNTETIDSIAEEDIFLNLLTAPGMIISMLLLSQMGPKIQVLVSSATCAVMTATFAYLLAYDSDNTEALYLVLCSIYFLQGFGGGICNYVLSTDMYPIEVRSTFGGISAALAKLGGLIGIFFMTYATSQLGTANSMAILVGAYIVQLICTYFFVDDFSELENDHSAWSNDDMIKEGSEECKHLIT